ncbi:hypothetical protein EJB05_46695 [Eragrostis curvula]|uniref:PGG domain-containing protein n=1 Tax=Eragrostis curvula TaxID=38414 RepID=A0A5J9TNN6_9POAL|nr:hypothetical protein EJB05_46695 [Eragrostis curvula]
MGDAKKLKKPPPLLPLSMEKQKQPSDQMDVVSTTKQLTAKLLRPPLPAAVKLACVLAVITAFSIAAGTACALIDSPCDPAKSSLLLPCIELTDAAGAKVIAQEHHQLWVSGLQAAAAVLGLLLPGRSGRAVAFIALAVGVVNLYMVAVVDGIFAAAAPGNLSLKTGNIICIVIFAVLYLMGFLALLLGRDDDDE